MFADDIFRRDLAALVAKLTAWAEDQRTGGTFDVRHTSSFWSLSARPSTPGTCLLTLVLRYDQKFDLALDSDKFEDRPIVDFDIFADLLEAVADGRAERRRYFCSKTGRELYHDMRIVFRDGRVWSERICKDPKLAQAVPSGEDVLELNQRFLPYLRT